MFLSGERRRGRRRVARRISALLLLLSLVFPAAASAVTYESEPAFCEGETVHDYMAPFERMPQLHEPSETGHIGFGPANLRLQWGPSLVVGGGEAGFALSAEQRKPLHLRWKAISTLVEVNGNGRPLDTLGRTVRRLGWLKPFDVYDLRFEVPEELAFYRVTTVLLGASQQELGKFSSYYRVVRPTIRARLVPNARTYRPESTVFARVENFGTETALYGNSYSIEKLEGETWVKAPENPRGPSTLPLYFAEPGLSGKCASFWIPPSMPAGTYRMKQTVGFAFPHPRGKSKVRIITRPKRHPLTAEFEVVP